VLVGRVVLLPPTRWFITVEISHQVNTATHSDADNVNETQQINQSGINEKPEAECRKLISRERRVHLSRNPSPTQRHDAL
jgi:hypothetical protein